MLFAKGTAAGGGLLTTTFICAVLAAPPASTAAFAFSAPAEIKAAVDSSAEALARLQLPDGKFRYRVKLSGGEDPEGYNIVRHAGAAYALGLYENAYPKPQILNAVKAANHFLLEHSRPVGNALAVVSDPVLEKRTVGPRALLGGSALAVLSLIEEYEASPSPDLAGKIRKMGAFLIFLQNPDGSFFPSYLFDEKTRSEKYAALFYPGEATLALLGLYQWDPSKQKSQWLQAARKSLEYVSQNPPPSNAPFDSWMVQVVEKFSALAGKEDPKLRAGLDNFALKMVKNLLAHQEVRPDEPTRTGCFPPGETITNTAAVMEGLLAAYEFLPKASVPLWPQRLERGAACLLRSQIETGALKGNFPTRLSSDENAGALETRIDATQHAMVALLRYAKSGLPAPTAIREPKDSYYLVPIQRWKTPKVSNCKFPRGVFNNLDSVSGLFQSCDFSDAVFNAGKLNASSFQQTSFERAEFYGSSLIGLRARMSDLRGAYFQDVNLEGADFSFSDLSQATFLNTNLDDAIFIGANLRGDKFDQTTSLPFGREEAEKRGMVFLSFSNP